MKTLIADDNADDRRMLRCLLEHHGCQVIEAVDGQHALELTALHMPDLIISDALMPRMDGFQLLRAIKTDEVLKAIPFVFYSATYTGAEEAELAISLGAEAFIIKPKDPVEFWEELSSLIDECSLRDNTALRAEPIKEDHDYLLKYSNIVANKLEEKVKELELALSERKQTEHDLRMSEKKYRAIFENTQDVYYQVGLDGNIVEISPSILRHSGYSRDELIGTPIVTYYFYAEDRARLLTEIQEKGEVNDFEIRLKTKDGRLVYTSVNSHLLFDESGKPAGMEGSLRDITERKKMEDDIVQVRNEWVETFDTINEAITIHDRDFNIIRANRAAEELLGIPNQTIISRKCYESFHCSNCPAEGCPGIQAIESGKPAVMEHFEPHLGKYLEVRTIPRFDSERKIIGLVHIVRDITDRKLAEEEQENLQNQLRHSQKLEAIGTLAGGVAHDFNNILSVIMGYCNLMEMKADEHDPKLPYIREVLAAAERAVQLTQGLLIFSRRQTPELKPVDINEIVTRLKKIMLRIIGEDIETRIHLSAEELIVMGDHGLLEQVLMNFATNARDAMPEGGLLTIKTELFEVDSEFMHAHGFGRPGRYALVSVSDTGKGMSAETRERIFEPFFTTKEVGKGTGLGLSIVHGIIKQHDGYVNCYSEPDSGTIFKIYIPLMQGIVAAASEAAAIPLPRGTGTILVADDDANVRKLTKSMLEQSGYHVIEAADGQEAVELFLENKERIDLLLFDVIMPRKNGKEALEEIYSIRPEMKALLMSGYPHDIVQRRGITEGQNLRVIQKPVNIRQLLEKVQEVLDEGRKA